MLKHTEAPFTGKPFIPQPWQDDYLDRLFNTLRPDGRRQYQRSFLALPRKQGKALNVCTPVLTTNGWRTMGDIVVGDRVFHPSGKPVTVVAVSPVMKDRECYEMEFSCGEKIVADAEHMWRTTARVGKPGSRDPRHGIGDVGGVAVRTTRDIAGSVYAAKNKKNTNHSIPVAAALDMPHRELPIHPYVLGLWLGDGSHKQAHVAVGFGDEESISHIKSLGYGVKIRKTSINVVTLAGTDTPTGNRVLLDLRALGLFGNKHVPEVYLMASADQRRSLLQGLMDSDGCCQTNGSCVFVNTNRQLADSVAWLVRSLGMKANVKTKKSRSGGKDYGTIFTTIFNPWQPERIFQLTRKQSRIRELPSKPTKTKSHYIRKCEPCPSAPVRCIQVDASDGMFLVGRSLIPTHNSALCAVTAAYEGLFGPAGGQIIIAAGDRNQASLLFTACRRYIESNPFVEKRCRLYRNSIVVPAQETTIQFVSSEHRGKHGYNPSLVLLDEAHVQKDRDLIDVLESGMGARAEPLVIYITTAGMDRIGPCYDEWQRALKVRDGIIDDPTYLPLIYAADEDDDPFDEATWRKAQPNYEITTQKSFMEREAMLAKESVAQEIKFRTLYLNQWVSNGANKFFKTGSIEPILPLKALPVDGRPCYCGIDLSSNTDTTAFVAVWPQEDGTWDVHARIFIPEVNARKPEAPYLQWERDEYCILTEGDLVDYDVVRQYVLDFCEKYDVKGVGIDRYNATHITTQLIAEGIPIKPFGQGYVSMSSPCKLLEALVLGKRIRLDGNKALAAHLMNMQCRMDPAGNIKPTKEHTQSTQRIDAAVALVMALGVASGEWDGGVDYSDEILVL